MQGIIVAQYSKCFFVSYGFNVRANSMQSVVDKCNRSAPTHIAGVLTSCHNSAKAVFSLVLSVHSLRWALFVHSFTKDQPTLMWRSTEISTRERVVLESLPFGHVKI